MSSATEPQPVVSLPSLDPPSSSSVPSDSPHPTPSLAAETTHMDRLTQLQDALDRLAFQMLSSLDSLHTKAPLLAEARPNALPVQRTNANALPEDQFEAMTQQLSKDIVARLKEMDILASSLSAVSRSGGDERKAMEEAQKEVEKAEAERQEALERAERLLGDMTGLFHRVVDPPMPAEGQTHP